MSDPTACPRCGSTTSVDALGAVCPECEYGPHAAFTFPLGESARRRDVDFVLQYRAEHPGFDPIPTEVRS